MKLKLDENLGERGRDILSRAGHDVATVASESVEQATGAELIEQCRREGRALVTLDLDFANPLHLKPRNYSGLPSCACLAGLLIEDLLRTVSTLSSSLKKEELSGKLWIVEAGRIRIFQEEQQ